MNHEPKVTISTKGNTSILEITGDVTTFAEKPINDAFEKVRKTDCKNVLLKFTKENFINSAGIAIIIGIVSESKKNNQSVAVCGLSSHFEKIFDMIGLTDYVTVYPDEATAIKNFS